ncbi:MAG: DUF4287 domain-containing protein [Ignavibacteriae bacterium]|nr:DUF4287 domain-containing protein [Ignavibacteriota bacterium]
MKNRNPVTSFKSTHSEKSLFMEETLIKNLQEKTGKTLEEWISIVKESAIEKHKEIVEFIKTKHGLSFAFANLIALKAQSSDSDSNENSADKIKTQSKGKLKSESSGFRASIRQVKTG